MTNSMMTKVSKAMLGKREITVTEYFPEGQKTIDMISNFLQELYLKNLRKFYTDDELEVLLPIFYPLILKTRELRKQNYTEKEINKIILDDFQKEMLNKEKYECEAINKAMLEGHKRKIINEVLYKNGE